MRPGQHRRAAGRPGRCGAGERGGRVPVPVRPWVQAQQPEHAGCIGRQVPVGPGEHAGHRAARVAAAVQQVQPVLLARPARRPARPAACPAGPRPARPPPATPAAAGRTARPASARPRRSASARPPIRARSSATASAAGSRSRSSRRAPSRATSPASESRLVTTTITDRRAGQQRPHLLHGRGVVQHHQQPPARHQRPVPGRPLGLPQRDVLAGHAQRAQEPGQRLGGGHRLVRVVAAQVDVELPVGEQRRRPGAPTAPPARSCPRLPSPTAPRSPPAPARRPGPAGCPGPDAAAAAGPARPAPLPVR